MNERTAGTSPLADEQADEMLALFGERYTRVQSGGSGYEQDDRPRDRKYGKGSMAPSVKTRRRK